MNKIEFKSTVTVFVVKNLEKSLEWYKKWLGSPDNIPMENVAEYEIKKMFGYSFQRKQKIIVPVQLFWELRILKM